MQFKVLILVASVLPFVSTIEVHENPVENTTKGSLAEVETLLKTTLPNSSSAAVLSGPAAVAKPPPPPPPPAEPTVTTTVSEPDDVVRKPAVTNGVTPTSKPDRDYGILGGSSSNYHQQRPKQTANNHKHSSSYRDTPLVVTPTVSSSSSPSPSAPSSPSPAPVPTSGSSGSSFKEDTTLLKDIIGSDLARHPSISAYKKRQLYSSGFQRQTVKNRTNERSYDRQNLVKEFIPSPEAVQLHNTGEYRSHYQGRNIQQVDAPYPSNAVDHDSRWYGGNHLNFPVAPDVDHSWPSKWDHDKHGKPLWLPNGQPDSDSPFSKTKPPANGKWKWVPEENGHVPTAAHGESQLVENGNFPIGLEGNTGGAQHQLKFPGHDRPYPFDSAAGTEEPGGSVAGHSAVDHFSGGAKLPTSGKGEEGALKHVSPWKKIFHVLTAAIPIGLIISALTPQVVYINPNMTQTPVQMQTPTPISAAGGSGPRQRAVENGQHRPRPSSFSFLTGDSGCEEKSFCELTRLGMQHDADVLAKTLWKIANETPADRARQSGLEEIFRAAKDNDCSRFRCENT